MLHSQLVIGRFILTKQHLLDKRHKLNIEIECEYDRFFTNHSKIILLRMNLNDLQTDIDSLSLDNEESVLLIMRKHDIDFSFDCELRTILS